MAHAKLFLRSQTLIREGLKIARSRSRIKRLLALIAFLTILIESSKISELTLGVVDEDNDLLPDGLERVVYGTVVGKIDTDVDGLMDGLEVELGTSPTNPDTDGDGILDGDEVMWGADPLRPSPLLSHAIEAGWERWVYRLLRPLDGDGVLDAGETALVRAVELLMDGPPEELRRLYAEDELRGCVEDLIRAVLKDGVVGELEERALEGLVDAPFYLLLDMCQSGILSEENLAADWDADGYSNVEEIETGTNPFNDLSNPKLNAAYGESERYLIIIQGGRVSSAGSLLAYHLAIRHGYDDDNILLALSIFSLRTEEGLDATALYWTHLSRGWAGPVYVGMYMSDVPWGRRKRAPSLGLIRPDLLLGLDSEVEDLLSAISEIPSDENDVIFVILDSHHAPGLDWVELIPGNLSARDLARALSNLTYGKLILLANGCSMEDFIRNLTGLRNALLISTTASGELIDGEFARIIEFLSFAHSYPPYYLQGNVSKVSLSSALRFFTQSVLEDEGYLYHPVWVCSGCSEDLIWDVNPLRWAWRRAG